MKGPKEGCWDGVLWSVRDEQENPGNGEGPVEAAFSTTGSASGHLGLEASTQCPKNYWNFPKVCLESLGFRESQSFRIHLLPSLTK